MTTASGSARLSASKRRFHRDRVALVGAFGDDLQAALLHGLLEARQAGAAEGIVLIEDRDLRDLEVLGQVLDPGLGLRVVARADIDDVVELGVAQELAPVKAPMNGTLAAVAIGCAAAAVGVPTAPIRAKTLSCSISLFVAAIDLSGS